MMHGQKNIKLREIISCLTEYVIHIIAVYFEMHVKHVTKWRGQY